MKSGVFDDTHQGVDTSIAIHITCAEAVHWVGQPPIVQPVETIAYLAELVGFASSARISASTSFICDERL